MPSFIDIQAYISSNFIPRFYTKPEIDALIAKIPILFKEVGGLDPPDVPPPDDPAVLPPDHLSTWSYQPQWRWNYITHAWDLVDDKTTGSDWRDSVPTPEDLPLIYPTANAGWMSYVNSTGGIYRCDGTSWARVQFQYPLATTTLDGLLSHDDYIRIRQNQTATSDAVANVAAMQAQIDRLTGEVNDISSLLFDLSTQIYNLKTKNHLIT